MPVPGPSRVAGKASERTLASHLFPCRVYFARAVGGTGPPEPARDVRSVVPCDRGNPAGDCSRSATPRSTDRLFLPLAHLGADSHSSSPSALCRAWRGHLPRWEPLGDLPSRLLLTRARTDRKSTRLNSSDRCI